MCVVAILDNGKVIFSSSCALCVYGNSAIRYSFRKNLPNNLIRYIQTTYPTLYYYISCGLVEDPAIENDNKGVKEVSPSVITL